MMLMAEQQLHLFEAAKPLLQRFGAEFFRAVPPKPGVYIMSGDGERVLYIGQSKNLRNRLGSYKNARPDRAPRKIIRLVHSVRSIVWEECETAEDALLKENQLLRVHRPKFNVMNTYPQGYGFVMLREEAGELSLAIGTEPKPGEKIYGAFKGGCVRAYGSLLRLLWAAIHQPVSPHDFPAPLLGARPPRQYVFLLVQNKTLHLPDIWVRAVEQYLDGTSSEIIDMLKEAVPKAETVSLFQQNLQTNDLEILTSFFEHGTKRNHDLRDRHGISGPIIPQEKLDDLLVVARKEAKARRKESGENLV